MVVDRVSYNSVVEDYRSGQPVFPPLHSYGDGCLCHVWPYRMHEMRTLEVDGWLWIRQMNS